MSLDKNKDIDSIGYYLTEHLRVAGAYWTLTGLACIGETVKEDKKIELIKWL